MDYWRAAPQQTSNAPLDLDPDLDYVLGVDVDDYDFGAGNVDVDAGMIETEDNAGAGAGAASSSSLRPVHLNYPVVNQVQDHGSSEEQMRSTEAFVAERERHRRPDQDVPRIQTQTQLSGVSPARSICELCQQCPCRDQGRQGVRAPPASMLMHRGERGGAPSPSPTLTSTRAQAQAQGHDPDPRRTDSPVPRPGVDYADDAPRAFAPMHQPPPRARQDTDADTASVQSMTELNAYLTWKKKKMMKKGSRANPVSISSDSGSSGDGDHGSNARNRNRAEIQTQSSHPGLELEVEGKFESDLEPDTDTEPEPEPQLEPTSPSSISSHPSPQLQTRSFSQTQTQTQAQRRTCLTCNNLPLRCTCRSTRGPALRHGQSLTRVTQRGPVADYRSAGLRGGGSVHSQPRWDSVLYRFDSSPRDVVRGRRTGYEQPGQRQIESADDRGRDNSGENNGNGAGRGREGDTTTTGASDSTSASTSTSSSQESWPRRPTPEPSAQVHLQDARRRASIQRAVNRVSVSVSDDDRNVHCVCDFVSRANQGEQDGLSLPVVEPSSAPGSYRSASAPRSPWPLPPSPSDISIGIGIAQ